MNVAELIEELKKVPHPESTFVTVVDDGDAFMVDGYVDGSHIQDVVVARDCVFLRIQEDPR